MNRRLLARVAGGMTLSVTLATAALPVAAHTIDPEAARDHCVWVGGAVQERQAFWGTTLLASAEEPYPPFFGG